MDIFSIVAERKIREAIDRGDLDNLALKGQPICQEDLSGVPEELRMGYKILKNAGLLPAEIEIKREILALKDLLACTRDEQQSRELKTRLSEKQLHFNVLMEKAGRRPTFLQYEEKLRDKLGV